MKNKKISAKWEGDWMELGPVPTLSKSKMVGQLIDIQV